jgi:conjugal transfer pilus assembly protein TraD
MPNTPRLEIGLLSIAVMTLGTLLLLPPTPWLAPDVRPVAVGLSALWVLWRGLALDRVLAHRRAWRHNRLWQLDPADLPQATPQRGIFLGLAFPWTSQYTQVLETALTTAGALPIAEDARGGHPCLHAAGQRHEQPLVLPWSELVGHALLTGTTRSGKTRVLEVLAAEAIRGPGAVVVIDPKGDRDLLARCAAEALRHRKPFRLITPAFPAASATMNPLAMATTPAELSARLMALMPSSREPFFAEFALAFVERVTAAQAAIGQPWTLEGLYMAATIRAQFEALLSAYLGHLGYHVTGKLSALIGEYRARGPMNLLAEMLIHDWETPPAHFSEITASLLPAFRSLIGGAVGPLFSPVVPDVTWQRLVDDGMVVYVALASLLLKDLANRIGRVILQDLTGFLGWRYAYADPATMPPITIFVDELRDVVYPQFVDVLSKGGGAHARLILAQQSLADTEAALGTKALARVLSDNCNTRLWTRVADDQTALDATEGLGLCTVRVPETGVGLSFGGVGGLSGSSQRRLVSRDVPLIRPTWLTALPRGEAFVRMKGEVWKLRVPLLTPVPKATLDACGLTALWAAMAPPPAP